MTTTPTTTPTTPATTTPAPGAPGAATPAPGAPSPGPLLDLGAPGGAPGAAAPVAPQPPAAPPAQAPDALGASSLTSGRGAPDAPESGGLRVRMPKPADLPDEYYDAKTGELLVGSIAKRNADLRAQVAAAPKAPDTYTATIPDQFKPLYEGVDLAKDPLAVKAWDVGRKHNLTQAAMDDLTAAFVEHQAALIPDRAHELAAVQQALGPNAQAELNDLGPWATRTFLKPGADGRPDPAMVQAVTTLGLTASGVLFLRQVRAALGETPIPGAAGPTNAALTEADLKTMMADPRYWRDRDPAYMRQVTEGFQRLYPGQHGAAVGPAG